MGEFKRIAVTAAEEDDEVIVAGIGADDTTAVPEGDKRVGEPEDPKSEQQTDLQRSAPAKEPPESTSPSAAAPQDKKRPREDGYRETTLDDLKSEPMPAAQKITIVAVIAILIVAIVYYFAFLR